MRRVIISLCMMIGVACTGCDDGDYTMPKLVSIMQELHVNMVAQTTCDAKISFTKAYLDKHERDLAQELAHFNNNCPSNDSSGVRCQSYRMLMGSRLELALRACLDEDVNQDIPVIYQRFHDAFGVYFDSVE